MCLGAKSAKKWLSSYVWCVSRASVLGWKFVNPCGSPLEQSPPGCSWTILLTRRNWTWLSLIFPNDDLHTVYRRLCRTVNGSLDLSKYGHPPTIPSKSYGFTRTDGDDGICVDEYVQLWTKLELQTCDSPNHSRRSSENPNWMLFWGNAKMQMTSLAVTNELIVVSRVNRPNTLCAGSSAASSTYHSVFIASSHLDGVSRTRVQYLYIQHIILCNNNTCAPFVGCADGRRSFPDVVVWNEGGRRPLNL